MSSIGKRNKKSIAGTFLLLLTVQTFYPAAAYALTSGPAQPEMQKFQPAGVNNMVDLFSGDFKYDIPLLDVGGYPVNLSYHSGGCMEDEASWVGMGWSLGPGSVNRNMRGIPDDFNGKPSKAGDPADMIRTIQHKKDFYKIGGQIVVKPSAFGWEIGKPSLHLGVYKDNYYGIGGEVGASLDFNIAQLGATSLTAGLGLNSDSREGVTLQPSLTLSAMSDDSKESNGGSLTGGFTYNTRSGLEEVNLGLSFSSSANSYDDYGNTTGSGSLTLGVASFNKDFIHTYTPSFGTNSANANRSFSFDLGPALFGGYVGFGGNGYIYTQKNTEETSTLPAFGYMNYTAGSKNTNAILDFNREKDGAFLTSAPAIPIPVATEDYFTATSQAGVQQFRPYYNGEYTIFDRTYTTTSSSLGLGVTIGVGNAFQGGGRVNASGGGTQSVTHRWDNNYTTAADAMLPAAVSSGLPEGTWFKRSGELTMADPGYYGLLFNDNTQKVSLNAGFGSKPQTNAAVIINGGQSGVSNMRRYGRDMRTSSFSYLTADQASEYGLDKKIDGKYDRVDVPGSDPVSTVHKAHHISEITVTDEEGKRMVYGVPVYNTDQEEVSFNVAAQSDPYNSWSSARKTGLVNYTQGADNSVGNAQGRTNIYDKKIIPPYATSFLLSGILSSDYVDRTGDGISDDDLGTAVKFRYRQWSSSYHWRAPFEAGKASFNEGFLSDGKDDKGNYVFGTKELWYLDSIQSKTMVAVFYKSPRADGYGVASDGGGIGTTADQQVLKLDSIRLFSKAELASHPQQPIPLKVVHFEYDYSLYPGLPNNISQPVMGRNPLLPYGPYDPNDPYDLTQSNHTIDLNPATSFGKLTLRKVYFTFGANVRGRTNPYVFSYNVALVSDAALQAKAGNPTDIAEQQDSYTQRQTDRWGTYKQSYYNRLVPNGTGVSSTLNNSEFPYTLQPGINELFDTRLVEDRFAAKWQLSTITVPTGGIISVEYESDDYSYVQDRKAMEECQLIGVGAPGQQTGMITANKLYVKMPVPVNNKTDFINTYLSGPNGQNWGSIAYKVYTDVDNKGHDEYVIGYAEVDYTGNFDFQSDVAGIPVKMVNGYNPVSKAAWQLLQTDLPQLAYPNYDNSDASGFGQDVVAAVKSIIQAFANLRELTQSFDQIASGKSYADKFVSGKSMVRLNCPIGLVNGGAGAIKHTYGKLGGGSRVRRVEISDTWDNMGGTGAKPLINGIQYDYTTTDDKGNVISSGVAAYEPGIGNEENPFHEPVNFTEKIEWSQDRYHFIEKPYGESYFPAPEVGYSEVKSTAYGADKPYNKAPALFYANTGYTLSRFYTAKDFPTQADFVPLDQRTAEDDLTILLFASKSIKRVATSQGFKVTLNDMHGKPKSTSIYDKGGALISSMEYFYSVKDDNAPQKQLNNTVLTLSPSDGSIAGGGSLIGTDEELVTDIRESTSTSSGTSIGAYVGGFFLFWPMPYGAVNYNTTGSIRSYNSVSTIKVIHQYGILKGTKTTQNGSTLTADNLLWDGLTGQVLLARMQNEFDDYSYALTYPAHMAYDGMSSAYKNIGTLFTHVLLPDGSGRIDPALSTYFSPGDELVNVDISSGAGIRGWVIPDPASAGNYHLIDPTGSLITTDGNYKLVRSGRRNWLGSSVGSVVTMTNPLVPSGNGYTLLAGVDKGVLTSKAVTYKDEWDMPVGRIPGPGTETDACLPRDLSGSTPYLTKFLPVFFLSNVKPHTPARRNIFSYPEDNVMLADLVNQGISNGLFDASMLTNLFDVVCGANCAMPDLSQVKYYLLTKRMDAQGNYFIQPGDQAYIGTATQQLGIITFSAVSTNMTNLLKVTSGSPYMCTPPAPVCVSTGNGYVTTNFGTVPCTPTGFTKGTTGLAASPRASITFYDLTLQWQSVPFPHQTSSITVCTDPLNQVINPYYLDLKGNWRVDYDHVYQVNRVQVSGNFASTGNTIRKSGYFDSYNPFWIFNNQTLTSLPEVPGPVQHTLSDPRWEWTNKPVHFDQKNNEIESIDPLKRYSAAIYGYFQTLPTAVASNARQNEIAFDGFEDYYFSLRPPGQADPCPLARHLEMGLPLSTGGQICGGGNCIVTSPVHSGNYSLQLSTLNIVQPAGSATPPANVLGFDANGRYILVSNEQAAGFAPIAGKKYLLSVWVHDGSPATNKINGLQVTINGSAVDLSNLTVPVVEEWKKLEIPFTGSASGFTLQLQGGGMYIDDLRIHPFDSQLKSFVYDDRTMRLTGQLDENNFGVFYEYDEEGTPIRVKKETEKGVMTVKENRQFNKKYIQTSN